MRDFEGKVVVVTGGGSGIGAAICALFAREGSRVVVADIELAKAEAVAAELVDTGARATACFVDITSTESCEQLADHTNAHFGRCNLLVANAGVLMLGGLATRTEEDWRWVFEVNVFGTIRTVNAFMPQLRQNSGEAQILVTCSMAGLMASAPGKGVYNASKHAQLSYAETLRDELVDEGIEVNILLPGGTVSAITESERNRPSESGRATPISEQEFVKMLEHIGETEAPVTTEQCIRTLLQDLRNNETWINPGSGQRRAIEARFKRLSESFDRADANPA